MRHTDRPTRGFTLIELLVVISIIALLIAVLLPVLGSARRSAQMSQSLSNLRQINTAANTYGADNKGELPGQITYRGNRSMPCSWRFGGAFTSDYWAGQDSGLRDLAPSARPLNAYLYPGTLHPPVTGSAGKDGTPARPANSSERTDLDLPVYLDPRDGDSLQRFRFGQPTPGVLNYEDVGTSYHSNFKWMFQIEDEVKAADPGAIVFDRLTHDMGNQRLRNQTGVDTTRFVLYNDRIGDAIRERFRPDGVDEIKSEYGEINLSALAFLDGHCAYETVEPEVLQGDGYTFYFKP